MFRGSFGSSTEPNDPAGHTSGVLMVALYPVVYSVEEFEGYSA